MLASVTSFALQGIDAHPVIVEVDIQSGLPAFNIVGLPDTAVRESRERVRSALRNSGFDFPLRRITVNLAPAYLQKAGPSFDLAVACGILVASGQVDAKSFLGHAFCGELALDGSLRAVRGALCVAVGAVKEGIEAIVVPLASLAEVQLLECVKIYGLGHLAQLPGLLAGKLAPSTSNGRPQAQVRRFSLDLSDVRGHSHAKQALEIAAAGGHNLLMRGPPGAGKTMLSRRLPSILPPMEREEALDVTRVHSVAGALDGALPIQERPFRAPHHSISVAGLVGGGQPVRPGEISLAHNGVLFLDELAEFPRSALESLRQPLERGYVTIARASGTLTFPSRFTLIAATNPCSCGFSGDSQRVCTCSMPSLLKYRSKLSGPLLDRIDILIDVERPTLDQIKSLGEPECSEVVRKRVLEARNRQKIRLRDTGLTCNAQMGIRQIKKYCLLSARAEEMVKLADAKLALGGRGYVRVLRVARTAADLASSERIEGDHIALALGYRESEHAAAVA